MAGKSALQNALILIRCTKKSHKNCKPVRNALLDNSKNVLQSYTTNSEMDGIQYCVVGKAVVKRSDMNAFKSQLKRIRTKSGNVGVDKLAVFESN